MLADNGPTINNTIPFVHTNTALIEQLPAHKESTLIRAVRNKHRTMCWVLAALHIRIRYQLHIC